MDLGTPFQEWIAVIGQRIAAYPVVGISGLVFGTWLVGGIVKWIYRSLVQRRSLLDRWKDRVGDIWEEARDFMRDPGSPTGVDFILICFFGASFVLLVLGWAVKSLADRVLDSIFGADDPVLHLIMTLGVGFLTIVMAKISLDWVGPRSGFRHSRRRDH